MIPSIEQIIEDLLAGSISKTQAFQWLHQHVESGQADLRDHFAGLALAAVIAHPQGRAGQWGDAALDAYDAADAMMKERIK